MKDLKLGDWFTAAEDVKEDMGTIWERPEGEKIIPDADNENRPITAFLAMRISTNT